MTVHKARYHFGISILIIQFGSIAFYLWNGFKFQVGENSIADIIAGALMLFPITATYAFTFLRFVVANPQVAINDKTKPMDRGPYLVQYSIILLFGIAIFGSIFVLFRNELLVGGYENIKVVTGFLETLFGSYMALIFSSLFPLAWEDNDV